MLAERSISLSVYLRISVDLIDEGSYTDEETNNTKAAHKAVHTLLAWTAICDIASAPNNDHVRL